jgi:NAD(P)-dependent dehydrogenase (short-subunit alcohol dehydrogenase family)
MLEESRTKTNLPAVSNSEQIQETLDKVVNDFGKIDVFVANAGKLPPSLTHALSLTN